MSNKPYIAIMFGLILGGLGAVLISLLPVSVSTAAAQGSFQGANGGANGKYCTATAKSQFLACRNEVMDDFYSERAVCIQVLDDEERKECEKDATDTRKEGEELCGDQLQARRDLCDAIGEDRYDPNFDPSLFDDDFNNLTSPNPYYPLQIGNIWEYESDEEVNRVEVLNETKLIEGVTCIVVNDLVVNDDGSSEDTDDWFGHRKDGSVDYCGEEVKDFETFPGDNPLIPELVSIEGSFKVGRDGDLAGTIFPGAPVEGSTYRQEFSVGNAEDAATILSTSYGYGSDPDLDQFVPQGLAELMCENNDCVVTREFTPIEPDVFERKYYANGIGLFLEVNPSTGEVNQLVSCNFDMRCDAL